MQESIITQKEVKKNPMNEEFTTKDYYEVVYSQYEKIFTSGLTATGADDTLDQVFTLTIEQPSNGAQIIVTTLDDGVDHTSTIENMYFRRAYLVQFKNNDGKGLYLNDLGGLIEQDRTVKAIDPGTMQDRSAIILLQTPNQTIYAATGTDQYTITESFFVDKGTLCNFCVIPDDPSAYKPGILNFKQITANEDVYYIYATLPLPIDPRLNTEDYYIIDCGHSITTVNEIPDPTENAKSYYDNTEYVAVYIDIGGPYNGIGVDQNLHIEESSRYGKMLPNGHDYMIFDRWMVDDNCSEFSFWECNQNIFSWDSETKTCNSFSSVTVNIIDGDGNKTELFSNKTPQDLATGTINNETEFPELQGFNSINIHYDGRYQPWEELIQKYMHQWILVEIIFKDWTHDIDYTEKDDDLILRQDDTFLIECGHSTEDIAVSKEDLDTTKNEETVKPYIYQLDYLIETPADIDPNSSGVEGFPYWPCHNRYGCFTYPNPGNTESGNYIVIEYGDILPHMGNIPGHEVRKDSGKIIDNFCCYESFYTEGLYVFECSFNNVTLQNNLRNQFAIMDVNYIANDGTRYSILKSIGNAEFDIYDNYYSSNPFPGQFKEVCDKYAGQWGKLELVLYGYTGPDLSKL